MTVLREPVITINAVCLTESQCETVRVAVGAFLVWLQREGVQGEAAGGVLMERYLPHAEAVFAIMMREDSHGF
jgi:hypothetical protein